MDASAVAKAAGPSPAATLNRGGRPAKKAFGGCKRKAMASMVDKENIPVPQQQPEPHTGPVCPILRAKRSRTNGSYVGSMIDGYMSEFFPLAVIVFPRVQPIFLRSLDPKSNI